MAVARATQLGRLASSRAATAGARHRLLHLAEDDVVVMPYAHTARGWHAVIVAARTQIGADHVRLTEEQIAFAATTIDVDPDGYACLLWLTRVFQH